VHATLAASLAKCPFPVRQTLLGTAYCLVPRRLPGLLPMLGVTLRDLLSAREELPDPKSALDDPDGLCGVARLRDTADLIAGYRHGMFALSHAALSHGAVLRPRARGEDRPAAAA
jgi:hypothetical protein